MPEILILVDQIDGRLTRASTELVTLAKRLGSPVAFVVGAGAESQLAEFGAVKIFRGSAPEFEIHPVAPVVDALASLVAQLSPSAILIASSAKGKEIAGRLAVRIGSGVITDAIEISTELVATQSVFGGSTLVHSRVTGKDDFATIGEFHRVAHQVA